METDSNLRVDCLKRFETLWSQPWSMWALFVEASIWKICFCVVFPVLLLIQFPQFPLGLASNHLKKHLSSESWIMTNLVQGQNGQSQKKTNYRGEENHQKPRRQCPDGWMDGWTGQLELAAVLWCKFPKWKKSSDWLANVLMGSINKQTDAAKISIEGPLFGSFWSVPWERFQGDQDKPSLFKVQSRPWRWMGSSSGTAEACRNLQTEQSSNWHGMHFLKIGASRVSSEVSNGVSNGPGSPLVLRQAKKPLP